MKLNFFLFLFISILFISCKKKSEISKNFGCNNLKIRALEKVEDTKNLFTIPLPKNWKINLYQDQIQSSIFAADTTKQLTETVLIDVTLVQKNIQLNDAFLLKQELENLKNNFIKISTHKTFLFDKPSMISTFVGKSGKYQYQKKEIHTILNNQNFLVSKIKIYGNSLKKERLCKALAFIENIKFTKL